MLSRPIDLLTLCVLTATASLPFASASEAGQGNKFIDFESLPDQTTFPGPWERYIQAPKNKTHIEPVRIWRVRGNVTGSAPPEQDGPAVPLLEGTRVPGDGLLLGPGGMITLEFGENIAGRVCFDVVSVGNDPEVTLGYSESPFFAGPEPDTTNDRQERDLPLYFEFGGKTGHVCVGKDFVRGGFKYLTVQMPVYPVAEAGQWTTRALRRVRHVASLAQNVLGFSQQPESKPDRDPYLKPWVALKSVWVSCTAFPSQSNGRAYSGYFYSSSHMLNRIWYAGAWTLQLSTIDPKEGSSIIDYNRDRDHNTSPTGAWYSNFTIANGSAVTTDGAKRDRVVWPGDMFIAIPGIAVSTYDMVAVRNALDVLYHHQYSDGSLPYAGPPLGYHGEFSDTYHMHTLLGTYYYVLYSGDLGWLRKRWPAYVKALEVSMGKVDATGLLHVTSVADWLRPGMTGHNLEASAILRTLLLKSIQLAQFLRDDRPAAQPNGVWSTLRSILERGLDQLYCNDTGLYSDNIGRRSCRGSEHTDPQDGNSWALISGAVSDRRAHNVSKSLRSRWTKYGAPAVEYPNVISPFASGFELIAHCAAEEHDSAVELMLLEWSYLLEGPGFTNSTLAEGFRMDGYVQYPAYWSAARNSHCHGWATGPTSVLTSEVLGIRLLSPAGGSWTVQPHLTKWLGWARGGFATAEGVFEVKISRVVEIDDLGARRRKGQVVEIRAPEGTRGTFAWAGARSQPAIDVEGGKPVGWVVWEPAESDTGTTGAEQLDLSLGQVKSSSVDEWYMQTILYRDDIRLIYDDSFVAPDMEERLPGVVDWEALDSNYAVPWRDMFP